MEPTLVFSISTHQLSFPVPYSTFKAAAQAPVIMTLLCANTNTSCSCWIFSILRFSISASLLISFLSFSILLCSNAFSLANSSCLRRCCSCNWRAYSFWFCCQKNRFLFSSLSSLTRLCFDFLSSFSDFCFVEVVEIVMVLIIIIIWLLL